MTAYTGQLPEDFEWRIRGGGKGARNAPATLVHGSHRLAVVKPMGRAWVVVFNPAYSPSGFPTCIVPNRCKGQAWAARWLRSSLLGIKRVCARMDLESNEGRAATAGDWR
ncbi:MAG: hypothetical protein EOP92_20035 [Lysobacteraceae bacterium]|nr:MAG: hypothetical protein EOP92_20035 [Xanthomonadaceae bacterium]